MEIREREAGDKARLEALIDRERDAVQRDLYRIAWLALKGRKTKDIVDTLGCSRRTVQAWAYRYRDGGIPALTPGTAPGHKPRLQPEQQEAFRQRFIDGPVERDGVCTLRAKDARRILREEFGVAYTLGGVYDLLHRLGLSCLKPRPRHEASDPEAMRRFTEAHAPFLSARSARRSSR